jgi:protein SCO1/2
MRVTFFGASLLALNLTPALGEPMPQESADAGMHMHESTDPVNITWIDYRIPDLKLVRDNGATVSLPKELDDGRPVVMNFIYTTCETTCPLSSATFAQFQARLGADRKAVHLVSISIDPEQDSPARLRAYAKRFHAGPGWQHYTGTLQASLAAQQAFGAYRGDKMSHIPVTLLRAAPGKAWMRIDGFVTPDQLLHHYHEMLAAR